jgi:phenylacetate-CoA ligase
MLHRSLFTAGCLVKYPGLVPKYLQFQKTQWLSRDELRVRQEQALARLIEHCYKNVPYYHSIFNKTGLKPAEFRTISDLQKLPVLNKQTLKNHPEEFKPTYLTKMRYLNRSTSGSTGMPLKYRVSRNDWEYAQALILRDWGYAGFKPGDRNAGIGCQVPKAKPGLTNAIKKFLLNQQGFFYMNVNREKAFEYFNKLNCYKPRFLSGGPLPTSLFAKFMRDNGLELQFKLQAIITNGEKLFEHQRNIITEVLKAPVYDWYGLDDGGLSAFECSEHKGLHVDMERAILEVVDEKGQQVFNQEGRILATSLQNYAMPFLRYDTGDLGILSERVCSCGREMPLLEKITGRVEGYIETTSGIIIHGTVFQLGLDTLDNVSQFQVIQEKADEIVIKVVPDKWDAAVAPDIGEIQKTVAGIDPKMRIKIELIAEDRLEYTAAGKYRFVINKLNHKTIDDNS